MEVELEEMSNGKVTMAGFPSCFKCVVCGSENHSEDGARMLPCLHHVCSDTCITKARHGMNSTDVNSNTCPVCSTMFRVEQTGRNKFTKDYPGYNGTGLKNSQASVIKCTFCVQGNSASAYCIDCKQFLCSQCADYHMKMSMTMQHSYSSVEEGMIVKEKESSASTITEVKCRVHNDLNVLYCVECDEELCQKCSKSNLHASHELRTLADCVKEFRGMLSNAIPEFIAYRAKTDEAIIDLESKATNILGTERIKLLSNARAHFHKIQTLLLQRELELRTEIVKKTLYKAKELNVKRACVQSLRKQAYQYLEVIPKLLEYKDHQLFSKRRWLTKQYFRLRERVGVLLDDVSYKNYVESEWFFHIGDGVLLETIVALKALGGFIYTDGVLTQDKLKPLQPLIFVPSKEGTIESIFEKKYRDKHPKELTDHLFENRQSPANEDCLNKSCEMELEALEVSVENEYIGFDKLKKENNQNLQIKEKTRFLSSTTLENLLDEKIGEQDHPMESDLLSKYIADKTSNEDTLDSNSEYDPVVQTARGIEKRRNTHSDSDDDRDRAEVFQQVQKKRGRKPGSASQPPQVAQAASVSPSSQTPQPVRKSGRFEVSPRPGLALVSSKVRRGIAPTSTGKHDAATPSPSRTPTPPKTLSVSKPLTPTKTSGPKGRPPKTQAGIAVATTPVSPGTRKTTTRLQKADAPPRLTREVFLDAEEVDELLGTPTESEAESVSDDGDDGGGKFQSRKYSKKRKGGRRNDDDDFEVSGLESEEQKKAKGGAVSSKKRSGSGGKDPFTKSKRRKTIKKKESELDATTSSQSQLAKEILFQSERMKISSDDNNEDYCTVCLDGGDNLICCDNCPKVFHIKCHIPALKGVPPDAWQCICCVEKDNLDEYTRNETSTAVQSIVFPKEDGMKKADFIYACKFIAEIYTEKSSLLIRTYFEKMGQLYHNAETPLHLNLIRNRLTLLEEPHFKSLKEVENAVVEMRSQASQLFQEEAPENRDSYNEFADKLAEILQKYFPKETDDKPEDETPSGTEKNTDAEEETH